MTWTWFSLFKHLTMTLNSYVHTRYLCKNVIYYHGRCLSALLFVFYFALFGKLGGKELSSWLSACAVLYLMPSLVYVFHFGQDVNPIEPRHEKTCIRVSATMYDSTRPAQLQKPARVLKLRNRSALTENCWVLNHCLEVSCKDDQITSA